MSKIDRTTPASRVTSVSRRKKSKPLVNNQEQVTSNDFLQLKKEVTSILNDKLLNSEERADLAFRKIITWKLGEASLSTEQVKKALQQLNYSSEHIPEFSQLIERLKK